LDVDDDDAIAMIMSGSREQLVTAAKHVLPHQIQRHVRVAGFRQVAVRGAANETAIALRIEPTRCFSVGDDRRNWCAVTLTLIASATATAASPWSVLLTTLSAAAALVASASSVVAVVVVALTLSVRIAFALLSTAATAAALRTRIVLLLRLLLLL
jgi:hypothetical protein